MAQWDATQPAGDHSGRQAAPLSRMWMLLVLPAGFVFGLIAGFMHASRFAIGHVELPWGSALVLVTLVVTVRALSLNMETRTAGAVFFGGWFIATGLMALPNPSGDVVFTAEAWSIGYLMAGCVVGAAASVWPLFLAQQSPGARDADAQHDAR